MHVFQNSSIDRISFTGSYRVWLETFSILKVKAMQRTWARALSTQPIELLWKTYKSYENPALAFMIVTLGLRTQESLILESRLIHLHVSETPFCSYRRIFIRETTWQVWLHFPDWLPRLWSANFRDSTFSLVSRRDSCLSLFQTHKKVKWCCKQQGYSLFQEITIM